MKARLSYPLIFFLPCALAAGIAGFAFATVSSAALWLFVYGDGEWPDSAGTVLMALAAIVATTILAALVSRFYAYGKRREALGGVSRRHVAMAVGISVLLLALILVYQW
ncbi:hypothetical protein [Luteimonas salinilitoris]|uniref:Transmembrane protein n=1 Tax=Luteimonas salinilitoris TaxID=3237697 RepID=A0ABV4HQG2_9GAMM